MAVLRSIGKYEILEQIGQGGFAAVYKARDPFIKRLVAIKLCLADDGDLRRRFFHEAEIAGNLHHPNIVTVFECGLEEGAPYLVQEYVAGSDLGRVIRERAPLGEVDKLESLMQVARALHYAHSKGVLHRDVKPQNVLVPDQGGGVKLMDFGIATLKAVHTRLTRAGTILGTASYLAPEQLLGQEPDRRVDLFSFGVLAYELLSYEKPFGGGSFEEVSREIVRCDPPPVEERWPDCPADLAAVVHRCLRKDPDERYASFEELLPELNAVLVRVRPERRKTPRVAVGAPPPGETPAGQAGPETAAPAGGVGETGAPRPRSARPDAPRPGPAAVAEDPGSDATSSAPASPAAAPPGRAPGVRGGQRRSAGRQRAAAIAVAALALAVLGTWWLVRGRSGAAPPGPPALLRIDASPWAAVTRIVDGGGREVPLPAGATTPLALEVHAGRYRVSVAHPDSGRSGECAVVVGAATGGRCHIELATLDAVDYFKQAGWWR